ncbi:hypothetical protein ACUHGC_10400 [Testudinibacter sp. P27/CKL/0425]
MTGLNINSDLSEMQKKPVKATRFIQFPNFTILPNLDFFNVIVFLGEGEYLIYRTHILDIREAFLQVKLAQETSNIPLLVSDEVIAARDIVSHCLTINPIEIIDPVAEIEAPTDSIIH